MKDEEMADKLAEELEKKAIDVIRNQSHKLIDNFTQEDLENREISIFLAGYHEGLKCRPQWHDLRKDPNDLPKKEGCYLVCMEFNYRHTYILNYGQDDYDDEEKMDWYDDESTHYPKEVIAWCEIPTFDKE